MAKLSITVQSKGRTEHVVKLVTKLSTLAQL
jgi:hypothetical protein